MKSLTNRSGLLSIFAAVALIVAGATQANAGQMLLQIQQGGGPALNIVGTPNAVTTAQVNPFGVTVGDYFVTASTGSSNSTGNAFNALLGISNLSVTRTGMSSPGTALFIRVLAYDFTNPNGNPLFMGSTGTALFTGQSAGDTVRFQSFFDASNSTTFGAGVASTAVNFVSALNQAGSLAATAPTVQVANPNDLFALSSITRIDLLSIGETVTATGGTEVRANPFGPTPVPEPASVALAFMGLAGFGGYARRMIKARA